MSLSFLIDNRFPTKDISHTSNELKSAWKLFIFMKQWYLLWDFLRLLGAWEPKKPLLFSLVCLSSLLTLMLWIMLQIMSTSRELRAKEEFIRFIYGFEIEKYTSTLEIIISNRSHIVPATTQDIAQIETFSARMFSLVMCREESQKMRMRCFIWTMMTNEMYASCFQFSLLSHSWWWYPQIDGRKLLPSQHQRCH